jgi:tRNA(fMet)-specific endonuclease VapC
LRGYLLDTNHVGAMYRQLPKVMARLNTIPPEYLIRVSTITLGEIEAGNLITKTTDQLKRDEFIAYVNEVFLPYALCVTKGTRIAYAKIIEKILQNIPKIAPDKKTERHLVENGIDINDVWIAAVAVEHGLVLVTHDGMEKIREAIKSEIEIEDWL